MGSEMCIRDRYGRVDMEFRFKSVSNSISHERLSATKAGKGNDHSSTELVSCFATRRVLSVMFRRLQTLHIGSPRRGKEIVAIQFLTGNDHSLTKLVSCFATRKVLGGHVWSSPKFNIGSPRGSWKIAAMQGRL